MRLKLNPNQHEKHHCICRETVTTEAVECIEQVTVNSAKNPPHDTLFVYVLRDADFNYGILDPQQIGYPHTQDGEVMWFEATSVEECITLWQDFIIEAQAMLEKSMAS